MISHACAPGARPAIKHPGDRRGPRIDRLNAGERRHNGPLIVVRIMRGTLRAHSALDRPSVTQREHAWGAMHPISADEGARPRIPVRGCEDARRLDEPPRHRPLLPGGAA